MKSLKRCSFEVHSSCEMLLDGGVAIVMIIKAITKIIGGDFAKSSLVMSDLSMMSCIHFIRVMSFLHHKIVLNCGFLISIDTTGSNEFHGPIPHGQHQVSHRGELPE